MKLKQLLHDSDQKMNKSVEFLKTEFAGIRTGKASPALIENITVEYYGNPTKIKELAGISVPEARLLVVQPWDPTVVAAVEKAIRASNLGFNPVSDGKVLRIPIPELSEQRRNEIKKALKTMAEEARIAIRNIRRETIEAIKKMQKDSIITEDEMFHEEKVTQEKTDAHIKEVDTLLQHKEHEIMEV